MPIDVLFLGGTSIDLIQIKTNQKNRPRFIASTGGSVTNAAVISAKLGLKVAMLSRIGRDPLGDFAVRFLDSCGGNTKGIIQDAAIRTPIAVASIDKYGNSKYTFYKNTTKKSIVPFKNAPKDLLRRCRILHFGSSFSYQKDTSQEALKYVKFVKKHGGFISLDPNIRPYAIKDKKGAKKRLLGLLKWVDLLKLSDTDLLFLTGRKDPRKGLEWLKKRFGCEVVLTLGSKGCAYLDQPPSLRGASQRQAPRSNLIKIPAFKVKIADTIGAGDAFTAGILYKVATIGESRVFEDIRSCLRFASAVSALICTKKGANEGLKGLKEVENFLS